MKKYEKPICEVIVLEWKDVIRTSDDVGVGAGDNTGGWTDVEP